MNWPSGVRSSEPGEDLRRAPEIGGGQRRGIRRERRHGDGNELLAVVQGAIVNRERVLGNAVDHAAAEHRHQSAAIVSYFDALWDGWQHDALQQPVVRQIDHVEDRRPAGSLGRGRAAGDVQVGAVHRHRAGDRALVDRDASDHLVGRVIEDVDPRGAVADQVEVVPEFVQDDVGGRAALQRNHVAEGRAGGLRESGRTAGTGRVPRKRSGESLDAYT